MATKAKPKTQRKKKQHTPDYYPIQRKIPVGSFGSAILPNTPYIADTGQLLSQVNRRLYRQGMCYQVKIDIDNDVSVTSSFEIDVYALVNNWDNQRAWALAKHTYDMAMKDERNTSPTQVACWEDFRVQAGILSGVVLDPVLNDRGTLADTVVNAGEHNFSIVDEGGTSKSFTWGNAGATELSLVSEWDLAGQVTADPASGESAAAYAGVNSDDLSDAERTALRERGDLPPYNQNNNPEVWVRVGKLYVRGGTQGEQRLSTGYFDAPCGLVVLKSSTVGDFNLSNGTICLTAKAGDYKGVSSSAMSQPE